MIRFNNIACLATANSVNGLPKYGAEMSQISELKYVDMIFDERIRFLGSRKDADNYLLDKDMILSQEVDMTGKTVLPGFVDSHTHIVFGGNRSDEFARRLRGVTYAEIAAEGGGIQRTVKATREASVEELFENGKKLAISAIKHGTTSIEIKSGYSLNLEGEIKQLQAAKMIADTLPINVKITFMGAHDFPPEFKNDREAYIDLLIKEMLPAVKQLGYVDYCDIFVDKGYYTLEQGERIMQAASEMGFALRMHCDELADVSAAQLAAKVGSITADHLLFASDESIKAMKEANVIAGLLPGTAYFIKMPYAPARKMIDAGLCLTLSTDCNPGSCFTENMQTILSLAAINMGMNMEECLTAATINGAYSLGIADKTGSLEIGKDADFIVCNINSYTDIFYHFAINHVSETWIKGKRFNEVDYL